jgi:hypothetical protein
MNLTRMTGWFVLILVVAGVSSFVTAQVTPDKRPAQIQATSGAGRYQIFFSPHARADTFLIDTQTGKIWSRTKYTDIKGEPEVWELEERLDSDAAFNEWLHRQTPKDKGQAAPN